MNIMANFFNVHLTLLFHYKHKDKYENFYFYYGFFNGFYSMS